MGGTTSQPEKTPEKQRHGKIQIRSSQNYGYDYLLIPEHVTLLKVVTSGTNTKFCSMSLLKTFVDESPDVKVYKCVTKKEIRIFDIAQCREYIRNSGVFTNKAKQTQFIISAQFPERNSYELLQRMWKNIITQKMDGRTLFEYALPILRMSITMVHNQQHTDKLCALLSTRKSSKLKDVTIGWMHSGYAQGKHVMVHPQIRICDIDNTFSEQTLVSDITKLKAEDFAHLKKFDKFASTEDILKSRVYKYRRYLSMGLSAIMYLIAKKLYRKELAMIERLESNVPKLLHDFCHVFNKDVVKLRQEVILGLLGNVSAQTFIDPATGLSRSTREICDLLPKLVRNNRLKHYVSHVYTIFVNTLPLFTKPNIMVDVFSKLGNFTPNTKQLWYRRLKRMDRKHLPKDDILASGTIADKMHMYATNIPGDKQQWFERILGHHSTREALVQFLLSKNTRASANIFFRVDGTYRSNEDILLYFAYYG